VDGAAAPNGHARPVSRFWNITFRLTYWLLTRLGPLLQPWASSSRIGNIVELIVPGRMTGRRRVVLLGLLRVDQEWYLGHPNGQAHWTRNLDAAGEATLVLPHQPPIEFRAELLPDGEERRRVIAVTWRQHVFPGNILYWLARRHVLGVGRYYRVERVRSPI
jgi:hypothetical protein